jgi:hypothetical protein
MILFVTGRGCLLSLAPVSSLDSVGSIRPLIRHITAFSAVIRRRPLMTECLFRRQFCRISRIPRSEWERLSPEILRGLGVSWRIRRGRRS